MSDSKTTRFAAPAGPIPPTNIGDAAKIVGDVAKGGFNSVEQAVGYDDKKDAPRLDGETDAIGELLQRDQDASDKALAQGVDAQYYQQLKAALQGKKMPLTPAEMGDFIQKLTGIAHKARTNLTVIFPLAVHMFRKRAETQRVIAILDQIAEYDSEVPGLGAINLAYKAASGAPFAMNLAAAMFSYKNYTGEEARGLGDAIAAIVNPLSADLVRYRTTQQTKRQLLQQKQILSIDWHRATQQLQDNRRRSEIEFNQWLDQNLGQFASHPVVAPVLRAAQSVVMWSSIKNTLMGNIGLNGQPGAIEKNLSKTSSANDDMHRFAQAVQSGFINPGQMSNVLNNNETNQDIQGKPSSNYGDAAAADVANKHTAEEASAEAQSKAQLAAFEAKYKSVISLMEGNSVPMAPTLDSQGQPTWSTVPAVSGIMLKKASAEAIKTGRGVYLFHENLLEKYNQKGEVIKRNGPNSSYLSGNMKVIEEFNAAMLDIRRKIITLEILHKTSEYIVPLQYKIMDYQAVLAELSGATDLSTDKRVESWSKLGELQQIYAQLATVFGNLASQVQQSDPELSVGAMMQSKNYINYFRIIGSRIAREGQILAGQHFQINMQDGTNLMPIAKSRFKREVRASKYIVPSCDVENEAENDGWERQSDQEFRDYWNDLYKHNPNWGDVVEDDKVSKKPRFKRD